MHSFLSHFPRGSSQQIITQKAHIFLFCCYFYWHSNPPVYKANIWISKFASVEENQTPMNECAFVHSSFSKISLIMETFQGLDVHSHWSCPIWNTGREYVLLLFQITLMMSFCTEDKFYQLLEFRHQVQPSSAGHWILLFFFSILSQT